MFFKTAKTKNRENDFLDFLRKRKTAKNEILKSRENEKLRKREKAFSCDPCLPQRRQRKEPQFQQKSKYINFDIFSQIVQG